MLLSLSLVIIAGIAASYALEAACLKPASKLFWLRHWAANTVHISNWSLCFCVVLLITQRPWFSLTIVSCAQLFMLLVNQAKYHSLREPFLAQDFEYFSDAIKHPRLYLPFFGLWRLLLAVGTVIAAVFIGLNIEVSMLVGLQQFYFYSFVGSMALLSGLILFISVKQLPAVKLYPLQDQYDLGQFAFLYCYFAKLLQPIQLSGQFANASTADNNTHNLANIVAVQSESFFDPRQCYDLVNPSVLKNFDKICAQSICYGSVKVPAWGANTVRTECAFLTGLNPQQLGIHQFNPYRILAKQQVSNLCSQMKQLGYKTLCIHPYPASFYLRDKVFPGMGFDEFIDLSHFSDQQKDGQYISDAAVASKVDQLLSAATEPLFIFVITMENHGPLHLENSSDIKAEDIFTQQGVSYYKKQPKLLDDLKVYLRHLKNADSMALQLTESLKKQQRQGMLVWYGDHIPIMPTVYQTLGEPSPDTPYFIWHSDYSADNPNQQHRPIESLAHEILKIAKSTGEKKSHL